MLYFIITDLIWGFSQQLCDFGLATWAPTKASFHTDSDVVGTFGYLAPEYFMYGKVSDKVDVYAFGVVLLELLSGRKPICLEADKDQESLVLWVRNEDHMKFELKLSATFYEIYGILFAGKT